MIPADGFYEWRKTAKPKLPFAIAMKDGRPLTFAGLWENWKDLESGEWLRTCTIITGEPNEFVAQIHPRIPVILPERHHAVWLGKTDDGNLKVLLLPYPGDDMRMWEISSRVNRPKNDDPSLWEPTQTITDSLELERRSLLLFLRRRAERVRVDGGAGRPLRANVAETLLGVVDRGDGGEVLGHPPLKSTPRIEE